MLAIQIQMALPCVLALQICAAAAQTVEAQYIDYRPGTFNLIITAPHGGTEKPSTIQDRTAGCYNAATRKCTYQHDCTPDYENCPVKTLIDANTYQAAEKIRTYVYQITGRYPYLVANKLHRIKLDPNRGVGEAAFGESIAIANYDYYHSMIAQSKAEIDQTGLFNSLLIIDVHGQSHSHNLTELGYNLTANELDTGSYSLQRTSTLRYVANKIGNTNAIVIGDLSLGHLFEQQSIASLPSPVNPTVDGRLYFEGGHTVEKHSSLIHDGLQIEFSRPVRYAQATEFDRIMSGVATALTTFMGRFYSMK